MKNSSPGLCILLCLILQSSLYTQNYFQERYRPDDHIYGTWEAKMPESYTPPEELPTLTVTFKKSAARFSFIDSLEAIQALPPDFKLHFSLDSLSMFEVLSAGRLKVEMDDCERNRTSSFTGDFMLIKIRNQVRLFHTIENEKLAAEFAPIGFGFLRTKATELAADELIFDTFLFYVGTIKFRKAGSSPRPSTPTKFTNTSHTNWSALGLYGPVKTMNEKRFIHGASREEGTYALMLHSFIRYSFSPYGITETEQRYSSQDKTWLHYDYQGSYQRQTALKQSGPDSVFIGQPREYLYSDSIVFLRTDDSERVERYFQKEVHSIFEHQLSYDRIVERTVVKSAFEDFHGASGRSVNFRYSEDHLQKMSQQWMHDGKPVTTFEYYVYEDFDDRGNWTKRLVYTEECSDRVAMVETREFEYWEE